MTHDTAQRWNEMWEDMEDVSSEPDELLVTETEGLPPGRALDLGCGAGANAVWLAERGWHVTAVDYAEAAVEIGRRLAAKRGVEVDFVVGDAVSYKPAGQHDLITSFYIHLPPEERAEVLSTAARALAPGGTLLFVSHDRSIIPHGWTEEDLLTLTTPDEVVSELPGLRIERAFVLNHSASGGHASHAHDSGDANDSGEASSTVVRAVRPA